MAGDYVAYQRDFHRVVVDTPLDGSAVAATVAYAGRVNHTIFIQRIVVSYLTHVAGKVITVQDDAGTPVPIVTHADQAAGVGVPEVQSWDFGPVGKPLTEGKGLAYLANTGGGGFTGSVHIEGYRRLTATINTGTANTAN